MKRVLLTIAAVAALASCSKDNIVERAPYAPIAFDNAFVNNSTRAAIDGTYNTAKLSEFQVYGTITTNDSETANIFAGETVSKTLTSGTGDTWKYAAAHTQYWIPGNTYNFVAIADGNVANATLVSTDNDGMPTAIKLLDASKQHDVLYAEKTDITDSSNGFPSSVEFTFNHIMAKAKVTVKNTIETNSGYSYKVSGITLNDTAKNGTYDIANGTWSKATTPADYNPSFGNAVATPTETGAAADFIGFGESLESNFEWLIVPTFKGDDTTEINITFKRDYYYSSDGGKTNVLVRSETNTVSAKKKIEAGHAYNFVIKLGNPGEPIQFTVNEIKDWDYNHDGYNPGVDVK